MRISKRVKSIMRLMYEVGYISEEIIMSLFFRKWNGISGNGRRIELKENEDEKNQQEDEEKNEEKDSVEEKKLNENKSELKNGYNRKTKFRYAIMGEAVRAKYVEHFDVIGDKGIRQRQYYLTSKGYKVVQMNWLNIATGVVETWEKKEKIVLTSYDTRNSYRLVKYDKIKLSESAHWDVVSKIKVCIMAFYLKSAVMHDVVSPESELYSNNSRVDLLVEFDNNRYIGIEYERSLKSERVYLGYSFQTHGKTIKNVGYIKSRQEKFLSGNNKLERVIVVCDTTNIFNRFMSYLNAVMRPDDFGKYVIPDKFFVIDLSQYSSVADMLLHGVCTYCKKQKINGVLEHIKVPFRDLVTMPKIEI